MAIVSVVIIFLNPGRFLEEAIQSVDAQTVRDWELLLVDDGSTDGSSDLARRAARDRPERIRYTEHPRHENRGMSASRNLGARMAAARWIALLDSDDVWLPTHLERTLDYARAHPRCGLVYSAARNWFTWDPSSATDDSIQPVGVDGLTNATGAALAEFYLRNNGATPTPSSMLVRRDTWEALGGFEEEFRGMYEDQVFAFKAALQTDVGISPGVTMLYRQHAASCVSTSVRSGRDLAARAMFLRWAERHVRERHPQHQHLVRLIRLQRSHIRRSRGLGRTLTSLVHLVAPDPLLEWLRRQFR